MPLSKPDYQLKFALELEDPTPGPSPFSGENGEGGNGAVSPEEARLRSETARAALDGKTFAWMGEYRELRENGWDWRVAAYIAWAASPRNTREPKTQDELAQQHLGLTSDRAIHRWRQKNPAIDEMVAVLQAAPLWKHRAEIYAALIKVATSEDYKGHSDRKLALEIMGDYVPKSKLEAELNQRISRELDSLPFEEKLKLAGLDSEEKLREFYERLKSGKLEEEEDGEA